MFTITLGDELFGLLAFLGVVTVFYLAKRGWDSEKVRPAYKIEEVDRAKRHR
jgi:hypothetical protein